MLAKSDLQLLREYAEHGSETAFAEIVSRHTDLVYSAALRQVESPDLARDVAQNVFTDLARKSRALTSPCKPDAGGTLAGWLYRSTRFEALSLLRSERRRVARETQAMQDLTLPPDEVTNWERIRPGLDAAMADLQDADRDALLLRFFQNQDFRSVGAIFGISDNAAQQRVLRALEKLRKNLLRRGITTTSAALSVAISTQAIQAAPVGLAAALSSTALLGGAAATATVFTATAKTLAMTTAQKTWITIALTVAVGTGIYEARQASVWRAQVGELQQQQAQSARQIQRLQQERDQATQQLAQRSGASSNPNADKDRLELLRLRGEVAMLRQRTNLSGATAEAGAGGGAGSSASQKPANFPRDSWTYAGLATPEDALKSFMWAKSRGDTKVAFSTATPELKEQIKDFYFKGKSDEEIASLMSDSAKNQTGFQIVKRMDAADDQVILQIHIDGSPAKAYSLLTMQKQAEEWRVSAVEERPDGE